MAKYVPANGRLLRDVFVVISLAFVLLRLAGVEPWVQSVDAYAYWSTRSGQFYLGSAGAIGAYLYSPAFAQALAPLVLLPWTVFVSLWTVFNLGAYWWLVRRLALPLLLFLPVPFEIVSGNIHLLYAAVIVAGFRYPALWALPILTKVTPGIGIAWFAVRREWRSLLVALGTTAAIAIASAMLDPAAWRQWIDLLASSGQPAATPGWYLAVPLAPRLVVALALVAWGGVTDRRWTLPIAVTLALPIIWLNSLAVLVAFVPLARVDAERVLGRPAPSASSSPVELAR